MHGFMALIDPINALADASPGFVWRLEDGDGPGATALRPCGPDIMVNLSVWQTFGALRDFAYRSGAHLDAMRRRREWFHKLTEQHLVLWWIPAGHLPDIDEALHRLDLLRRSGPGPLAFTFREPYDPPASGQPGGPESDLRGVLGGQDLAAGLAQADARAAGHGRRGGDDKLVAVLEPGPGGPVGQGERLGAVPGQLDHAAALAWLRAAHRAGSVKVPGP
jgi:hypothetical protein